MPSSTKAPRGVWLAFSAVLVAAIMDLLDTTIAQNAAPAIRADLDGSLADLQWVSAAYTLALAIGLLTGGRLGDIYGRKRMLMVGVAGFTLASVLCAAAPTIELLVAGRAIQGLVGAVMLPQVLGVIRDLFPPKEMAKAFAILGPVAGMSAVLGPILSGLLIDLDAFGLSWRTIFLINVPVGIYALVVGRRHIPAVAPEPGSTGLDVRGSLLGGIGLLALVYPLVQGRELGWPAWTLAMLAGSVVVLVAFGVSQVRRARAGRTPLVEPSVFRHRSYTAGLGFVACFLASMGGLAIALAVLLQVGLGFTPIDAAIAGAPYAIGGFVGSGLSGGLAPKLGRQILQAGLVLKAAGMVWMIVAFETAGGGLSAWDFTAPLAVAGVGMGMVWVPLFDIVIGDVEGRELGSAASVLTAVQQLGMTLGIAVIGTVLFEALDGQAAADFVAASEVALVLAVAGCVVAFVLGFLLPRTASAHLVPAVPEPAAA